MPVPSFREDVDNLPFDVPVLVKVVDNPIPLTAWRHSPSSPTYQGDGS